MGATFVWQETQPNVSVSNGLFTVLLGSVTPVPDTVFKDASRYLGIKVGDEEELINRIRLVSVPWSTRVATVDGATGGNITSKLTIGTLHSNTGTDGFVAGYGNTVSGPQSSVVGGRNNDVSGASSIIAGGEQNRVSSSFTAISSGFGNLAKVSPPLFAGEVSDGAFAPGNWTMTVHDAGWPSVADPAARWAYIWANYYAPNYDPFAQIWTGTFDCDLFIDHIGIGRPWDLDRGRGGVRLPLR
jgi:hypothetical protein